MEENMAKVIILCGKIASGKTYYANKIKNETNAIILSVDDLMLNLSDSCLGKQHDDMALRCERYFYGLANQIYRNGTDVILDFGYWSKMEREEAKQYFRYSGIPVELHYVKIEEEKRLIQLDHRNKNLMSQQENKQSGRVYIIEEELRRRLDQKFEEPSPDEIDVVIS